MFYNTVHLTFSIVIHLQSEMASPSLQFQCSYSKGVAFIRAAQQLLTSPHFTPHYMTTGNREPKSVPSSNGTFTSLNCLPLPGASTATLS
jgi:hypothetical protein